MLPTSTPNADITAIGGGQGQLSYWAQDDSGVNIFLHPLDGISETGEPIGLGSNPAWSPDGSQVVFEKYLDAGGSEIFIMDADGENARQLTHSDGDAWQPDWSPDGNTIAYSCSRDEICLIDTDGTNPQSIVQGEISYYAPAWSSDGTKIAFLGNEGGLVSAVYIANKDGSNLQKVADYADWAAPPDWSPDDQWIAYGCLENDTQVCLIRPDGSGQKILTSEDTNGGPQWSPDGQWIAFISYRDDNWEVYIMKPDGSQQHRITTDWLENFGPKWRP